MVVKANLCRKPRDFDLWGTIRCTSNEMVGLVFQAIDDDKQLKTWTLPILRTPKQARKMADWLNRWASWKEENKVVGDA